MNQVRRKRILFVAEAVTLAHIVRPLVLAQSLDPARFEIHYASARRYDFVFDQATFHRWEINSVPSQAFLDALAGGSRLYSLRTLSKYVEEDLELLDGIRPDLVVGDFRLSLAVSAPLAKVPYAAIANAYWSPFTTFKHFPLPEMPITRLLGPGLASVLFNVLQPAVFAYHALPMNKLRQTHGLARLGSLLDVYTAADYTLYADAAGFFPTRNLPPNHRFLGPIHWSPKIALPDWWHQLDSEKPVVYVNLGSSGPTELLHMVTGALAGLPLTAILATAGRWKPSSLPSNIKASDFLPGDAAAKRAKLVICNGGSPSVYQALAQGVPVIGIASNMDQLLSMSVVERSRTGVLLRSGSVTEISLKATVERMIADSRYDLAAQTLAGELKVFDSVSAFRSFIDEVL